ncbi:MAG: hypothetical protein E7325_09410 [Clostridiales bacterium]|nr:hypothetical protein [Clostridiales bacterium]
MENIMITPGTYFDGYVTVEYGDPLSLDVQILIAPVDIQALANKRVGKVEEQIAEAKKALLNTIKKIAISKNYNGIIGFRYDCVSIALTIPPRIKVLGENHALIISVQGTPVKLEKE